MLIFEKVWQKFAATYNVIIFECCSFYENFFYFCSVEGVDSPTTYIFTKVFSQSRIENLTVFNAIGQRTALISCVAMCGYVPLCIYPILFRCGALYRLLLSGLSTTFYSINGIISTLSVFIQIHRIGDATVTKLLL